MATSASSARPLSEWTFVFEDSRPMNWADLSGRMHIPIDAIEAGPFVPGAFSGHDRSSPIQFEDAMSAGGVVSPRVIGTLWCTVCTPAGLLPDACGSVVETVASWSILLHKEFTNAIMRTVTGTFCCNMSTLTTPLGPHASTLYINTTGEDSHFINTFRLVLKVVHVEADGADVVVCRVDSRVAEMTMGVLVPHPTVPGVHGWARVALQPTAHPSFDDVTRPKPGMSLSAHSIVVRTREAGVRMRVVSVG